MEREENPRLVTEVRIGKQIFEEVEEKSGNGGLEDRENPRLIEEVRIGEQIIEEEEEEEEEINGGFEVTRRSRGREIGGEDEIVEEEEDTNQQNGAHKIINVKDYDIEKVLEEQETHDLYCPNCNSCITKRVILKKRRKTVSEIESEFRPNKIPNLGIIDDNLNERLLNRDEQHILFKCLSCFTFFIPTDCGFNIFDIFGGNKERINQAAQEIKLKNNAEAKSKSTINTADADSNQIWFFDVFGVNHKKPANNSDIPPYKPPPLFTPPVPPSEMKSPKGNSQQETPINLNPVIVPPRCEEITIVVRDRPTFRPRNCRLCPNINNWDILKPIVYGGLIESIASLSVVSSAAATGATTLNIFLLGIANLIGGLGLLLHELMELKRAQDEADDFNHNELGRYWALLGRKGYFGLHATIAIISYIFFGLLPPLIYGFTFRETDDSEYKIVAVALASIFCVGILAIGKAHVRPHRTYFTTFCYYVAIAVQSSGLAYVGGILVKKLIEKLGLFSEGSLVSI